LLELGVQLRQRRKRYVKPWEVPVNYLVGKIVDVKTPDMTYTGKLIELGEKDIQLESESGWVTIPVDMIVLITEKKG
jgi:hypothetical protein